MPKSGLQKSTVRFYLQAHKKKLICESCRLDEDFGGNIKFTHFPIVVVDHNMKIKRPISQNLSKLKLSEQLQEEFLQSLLGEGAENLSDSIIERAMLHSDQLPPPPSRREPINCLVMVPAEPRSPPPESNAPEPIALYCGVRKIEDKIFILVHKYSSQKNVQIRLDFDARNSTVWIGLPRAFNVIMLNRFEVNFQKLFPLLAISIVIHEMRQLAEGIRPFKETNITFD